MLTPNILQMFPTGHRGANVVIDRTTRQDLGNAAKTATVGTGGGVAAQRNTRD